MGLRTEANKMRKHSAVRLVMSVCVCVWGGGGGLYSPSTLDVFNKYYCTTADIPTRGDGPRFKILL